MQEEGAPQKARGWPASPMRAPGRCLLTEMYSRSSSAEVNLAWVSAPVRTHTCSRPLSCEDQAAPLEPSPAPGPALRSCLGPQPACPVPRSAATPAGGLCL